MKLNDLTLEELWKLFPITFTNYNENFKNIYLSHILKRH